MVRLLMGSPMESPASLVVDIILLVAVFLFTAYYRHSLPEGKITLKEAFLFGLGLAVVAALVYGLALWAIGAASPAQTALFSTNMTGKEVTPQDPQIHYWAAWWGLFAGGATALLGAFAAFLAAVLFRNEKSQIIKKQ